MARPLSLAPASMHSTPENQCDLFPLPLSDFEYYMLSDDRPDYPMVFLMRVHLSGPISESDLETALRETLSRHPLLQCRVQQLPGSGWCWIRPESPPAAIQWTTVNDVVADLRPPVVRSIDLQQSCGLFVDATHAADGAELVLHLHHACCDGIGAMQFVGEWLARYGCLTAKPGQRVPVFIPADPSLLPLRRDSDPGEAASERQKKSLKRTLGKLSRLWLRKPVLISAGPSRRDETAADGANHPAILSASILRPEARSLRALASQWGVSINDLCLQQMMIHIREWNAAAGKSGPPGWIRLAVPVSMRMPIHEHLPAANLVSYAFVTRRENECDEPQQLVQTIREQTNSTLYNREGIVFLKILKVLRKVPAGVWMLLNLKSCLSTAVLANVGDVRKRFNGRFPMNKGKWIVGNVVVERMEGVAPVRPNTRVAMSIGEYGGQMIFNVRTDARVLTAEASQAFLDGYVDRLRKLIPETTCTNDTPNAVLEE